MPPVLPPPRARAASALAIALLSSALPVRADAPAAPLIRVLASPGRSHALAVDHGRIPVTVALPPGVSAASLGLLPVAPGLGARRFSPADLLSFAASHPDLSIDYSPPRRPLIDVSKKWTRVDVFRKAEADAGAGTIDGTGVVVGIIDTGLDIRHPDFLDKDGKTRVAWLLDAGAPEGLHPKLEKTFGCTDPLQSACAVYAAADIDDLIKAKSDRLVDAEGHGTHVASIAAGNGGPSAVKKPRYVGLAPGATLIVATPGKFYDPDILNAARFIFDRAAAMGLPCVLNLSVGGDFGPHDGTSALEQGLAAMVGDDKPGRAVVVAAGNSGDVSDVLGDGGEYGIHTEVHVTPHERVRVPIRAGKATAGQVYVWLTFQRGDEIDVSLEGPGGSTWIGYTGRGDEAGYDDGNGTTAGVINNKISPKSSITAATNSAVVVWTGAWDEGTFAIHLRGHGDAQLWMTGTGDAAPSATSYGVLFERATREGTVTVPASHPGLLAVGCTLNRVAWKPLGASPIALALYGHEEDPVPDSACYFSSSGPTPLGVMKPELSAPGGVVAGAMSSLADPREHAGGLFDGVGCPKDAPNCYLVDARHAIASGTSMSAPHVTGAIALLFQLDRTLTQARVTDVLQAGARRPSGHVPYESQLGPGELDLEGARQALAAEQASTIEPSIEKSWYTLSSSYARADASFPIWGTVELRRADGKVASGLDGQKLTLSLTNAALLQPLTKVRHGLWRFAFAGREGTSGQTAQVELFYDGRSLGARSLPIGTDIWTSNGLIEATGGCAIGRRRDGGGEGVLVMSALAALAVRRARARRRRAAQDRR
ncbi:MAG: S8 family serine peptidase [Byssovorax sp.]